MKLFHPVRPNPIRWVLLVALSVVIPSCSSGGGEGTPFQDLFVEDFDGGLGSWTVVSPSVTVNSTGIGRGPSMHLAAQAGVPAEARTTSTFSTATGLTISLDSEVASSIGEVQIVDNASPAVRDTYVLIDTTSAHFSIGGQTHAVTFLADAHAHKYLFHVENGQAQWQRDGITKATGTFTAGTVFVDCKDLDSGSDIDLVHVSTP